MTIQRHARGATRGAQSLGPDGAALLAIGPSTCGALGRILGPSKFGGGKCATATGRPGWQPTTSSANIDNASVRTVQRRVAIPGPHDFAKPPKSPIALGNHCVA